MAGQPPVIGEGRLTESEFDAEFGDRLSQAIAFDSAGRCVVNSALTRSEYITWNWQRGAYDRQAR